MFTRHYCRSCRSVDLARQEHAPRHDEEFAGECDDRLAGPDLARLAGIELAEGTAVPLGQGMGGFDQEGSKERAPRFADAPLAVLLAGLHDRRIETGIPRHLFGPGEAMGIPEDRPRGGCADQAHAGDCQEHLDRRHVGDAAGDFALEAINLGLQRGDLSNR